MAKADRSEEPIVATGHNGTVSFDGDFVTITRTGFRARATVGKGEKRIPVRAITAIQWKPPGLLVNGYVQFTIGGGNEARSRFGSQTTDAVTDENSVIVTKHQQADFERLRTAVEGQIGADRQPAPATAVQSDVLAQLEQLARLRDIEVLTVDEFESKKADLLRRL